MKKNGMIEYLDIIDENDKIIAKDSYDEVHRKNLRHRVIHVMISNAKGELLLQMRSKKKKAYPLYWSMSVGGHVSSGETYEQAAQREMQEEVGIQIPMTYHSRGFYQSPDGHKSTFQTFSAVYNGLFTFKREEVAKIFFADKNTIKKMIANGEKFQPELLFVLKNYFNF